MNMTSGDEKEAGGLVVVQPERVSMSQGYKGNWKNIAFNEVEIGEQIGGGSVGIIYRGYYQGKKIALKTLVSALALALSLICHSYGHGTAHKKGDQDCPCVREGGVCKIPESCMREQQLTPNEEKKRKTTIRNLDHPIHTHTLRNSRFSKVRSLSGVYTTCGKVSARESTDRQRLHDHASSEDLFRRYQR